MQKFKVNGQSVPKIEWKQTDGRTDRSDRITYLANSVGKNLQKTRRCRAVTVWQLSLLALHYSAVVQRQRVTVERRAEVKAAQSP